MSIFKRLLITTLKRCRFETKQKYFDILSNRRTFKCSNRLPILVVNKLKVVILEPVSRHHRCSAISIRCQCGTLLWTKYRAIVLYSSSLSSSPTITDMRPCCIWRSFNSIRLVRRMVNGNVSSSWLMPRVSFTLTN